MMSYNKTVDLNDFGLVGSVRELGLVRLSYLRFGLDRTFPCLVWSLKVAICAATRHATRDLQHFEIYNATRDGNG